MVRQDSLASAFFALALWFRQRWRGVAVALLARDGQHVLMLFPLSQIHAAGRWMSRPSDSFKRTSDCSGSSHSAQLRPTTGHTLESRRSISTMQPVDAPWSAWVHAHLDTTTPPFYLGDSSAIQLRANVHEYEWVGVKYVVAPTNTYPLIETISTRTGTGNQPLVLQPGQSASGKFSAEVVTRTASIDAVGVNLANYHQTATGTLTVSVCSGSICMDGAIDLATTHDNSVSYIPLRALLHVQAGAPVRYTFADHHGGSSPIVLWMFPTAEGDTQDLVGPDRAIHGMGLQTHLGIASAATHAENEAFSTQTERDNSPLVLHPGQSASGTIPSGLISRALLVDAISVNSANYGETATGLFAVTVCSAANCTDGAIDLARTQLTTPCSTFRCARRYNCKR